MHLQRPFDPVVAFLNSQGEAARGTLTSLQRRSLVMEIYNPYSIVQVSEVLSDLTIRSGDRNIYKGKAVVVSLLNTGLMAVVSVTLIDEWNDLGGIAHDARTVSEAVGSFIHEWDSRSQVGHAYQVTVNEMRAYFSEVTRWLDQADITAGFPRNEQGKVRDDIFYEIAGPLLLKGRDYLQRFEEVASKVEPELEPAHRAFAQSSIHPLVLRAPFVYRTFAKPLGYAGDYQMVNQILGDPRQGTSTYFELVNFMFLQAGVAQAHRNRVVLLEEKLVELCAKNGGNQGAMRVLNVGCGPAAELQRLAKSDAPCGQMEVVLVDFSEETLLYAKQCIDNATQLGGREPFAISLQHESVHQLLKRSTRDRPVQPEEKFDYIYCAGLFDYLADKACTRLIEYFDSRLKPGGSLLVTNVHSQNPERYWMEHFMEWYLIYRNEDEIARLFPRHLGAVKTYTDASRINLFAEIVKPEQ